MGWKQGFVAQEELLERPRWSLALVRNYLAQRHRRRRPDGRL